MSEQFLKLRGRVVRTRASDQSILIKPLKGMKRIRVYAYDKLFYWIADYLSECEYKSMKPGKLIGIFHIQGRVLLRFDIGCQTSKYFDETPKELKPEEIKMEGTA
jgi:hypothetical protein